MTPYYAHNDAELEESKASIPAIHVYPESEGERFLTADTLSRLTVDSRAFDKGYALSGSRTRSTGGPPLHKATTSINLTNYEPWIGQFSQTVALQ